MDEFTVKSFLDKYSMNPATIDPVYEAKKWCWKWNEAWQEKIVLYQ